jgi:hypothetical protein
MGLGACSGQTSTEVLAGAVRCDLVVALFLGYADDPNWQIFTCSTTLDRYSGAGW